jgi:hypothetical protein
MELKIFVEKALTLPDFTLNIVENFAEKEKRRTIQCPASFNKIFSKAAPQ